MEKWDDNVAFSWGDDPARASQFGIVKLSDVANEEKSTSAGTFKASGDIIKYEDKVDLFPMSAKESGNVWKYSVYAQESGNMYFTDSIYTSWSFRLSSHNDCYKTGDVQEGIHCCNWRDIQATNDGVKGSQQRVCCRRTAQNLCHATHQRVTSCNPDFVGDNDVSDNLTSKAQAKASQEAAVEAEEQAAAAQVAAKNSQEVSNP